jgi:hypothetical protein
MNGQTGAEGDETAIAARAAKSAAGRKSFESGGVAAYSALHRQRTGHHERITP